MNYKPNLPNMILYHHWRSNFKLRFFMAYLLFIHFSNWIFVNYTSTLDIAELMRLAYNL